MLDGLQVTLAGSLAGVLEDKKALGFSDPQVAAGATSYLAGAVTGALLFGYLTDRLGRRKLGTIVGSLASLLLLKGHIAGPDVGRRIAFGVGAALGLGVFILRLGVLESPRWLMLRGREEEANKIVGDIDGKISQNKGELQKPEGDKLELRVRDPYALE